MGAVKFNSQGGIMKNVRKILLALCLVAVIVALAAVNSIALASGNVATGSETNFEDYWSVNMVLLDTMEDGTSSTAAATASGDHVKKPGKETAMIMGAFKDGTAGTDNPVEPEESEYQGAPYIYTKVEPGETAPTASRYYSTINYNNKDSNKLYVQPRFKNLSSILAEGNPTNKAAWTPLNGFVMEFDIATLEGDMPSFDIQIFNASSAGEGNISVAKYEANDGVATIKGVDGRGNKVTSPTVASDKGGWLHVTVLYNPNADEDSQLSVYVNKAQVDTAGTVERTLVYQSNNLCDAQDKDKKWIDGELRVYPLQARMGKQDATSGTFSLDNILFYQSTSVCDPEYLSTLSEIELFEKYIDVIDPADPSTETASAVQKFEAYETIVNDYLPIFQESTEPEIMALVARYNNFYDTKIEELQDAAKKENAATLKAKVNELVAYGRGFDNIAGRELAVSLIEQFIADVGSLIYVGVDETTDPYLTAIADYEAYSQYLLSDKDVRSFINRMNRFAESFKFNSSDAMKRHYAAAEALLPQVEQLYDDRANGFDLFGKDEEIEAVEAAKTAFDQAAASLGTAVSKTNARRFIDLMKLLNGTTRSDWDADTGVMRNLWYLARGIMLNTEEGYDATVEGFEDAKKFYDRLNAFFWAKLQDEHVALLTSRLDEFDAPGASYIDKAGVCTFVDNYIQRNDIDIEHNDSRIKNIKARNELYKSQLGQLNTDYSALLYQHTIEFKYKMDEIATLNGYADLKAAYDIATELYYTMNVAVNDLGDDSGITNEQLQIAIARYQELGDWLLGVETMSTAFIYAMQEVDAAYDKDELYAALLACYACEGYLDVTFEFTQDGVTYKASEYKARYDSVKSAYIASTGTANSESAGALDIVCATRAYSGVDELITFVQDYLK